MDDEATEFPVMARIGGGIVALIGGVLWFGLMIRYPALWLVPVAAGVVWIVVNEKKMRGAANPAPPPDPEGVEEEFVQFRTYEDRPGHWTVVKVESGEDES